MTTYPLSIDNNITIPQVIDKITPVDCKCANNLIDATISIENELGALVSREFPTLKERLDYLTILANNCQSSSGPQYPSPPQQNGRLAIVNGSDWETINAPGDGYILSWNNTSWTTIPAPTGGTAPATIITTKKLYSYIQFDNLNPENWANTDVQRFDCNNNIKITGFTPSKRKIIFNISPYKLILAGSSTSSSANNRILIPNTTYIIQPNGSIRMYYDYTSLKWRIS
jgi:hypothetical protein